MQVKKVAIDGPESTGKSQLALQLAQHFNAVHVDEAARKYLESLNRSYKQEDLYEIAMLQCRNEDEAAEKNQLIFCDTTLLVIKVWSEYRFGNCDERIEEEFRKRNYTLHLLTNIDLPWQDDPLREHPYERSGLFNIYHYYMRIFQFNYEIVTGTENARLQNAITFCRKQL
jgi:nicotinamide riboside kinase